MYKKICLGAPFKHKIELFRKRASEKEPKRHALLHYFVSTREQLWKKLDDTKDLGVWEVWVQFYYLYLVFVQASVVVRLLLTPEVSPVLTSGGKI